MAMSIISVSLSLRPEAVGEPLVVVDPGIRDDPEREVAEVPRVPLQELLQPRERQEGVHRDVGAIVGEEKPTQLLGEPEDLRGAEELAEEQPAEEGLGMHVGDALVVAVRSSAASSGSPRGARPCSGSRPSASRSGSCTAHCPRSRRHREPGVTASG